MKGIIERRRKCKVCKYCFNAYETDEDIYFKLNKKGEKYEVCTYSRYAF